MTKFFRRLWLNSAGHCGIAIPIEVFAEVTKALTIEKKSTGVDCSMEVLDGALVIRPVGGD